MTTDIPSIAPENAREYIDQKTEEIGSLDRQIETNTTGVEQLKLQIRQIAQDGVNNLKVALFPLLQDEFKNGKASEELKNFRKTVKEEWNDRENPNSFLAKFKSIAGFSPAEIAALQVSTAPLQKQSAAAFLVWQREFSPKEGEESLLLSLFTKKMEGSGPDGKDGWRTVNFLGNDKAEGLIGLGHMLDASVQKVLVRRPNGVIQEGKRALIQTETGRKMIGYVDVSDSSNYLEVLDGYQFRVLEEEESIQDSGSASVTQDAQISERDQLGREEGVQILSEEKLSAKEEEEVMNADIAFLSQREVQLQEEERTYGRETLAQYLERRLQIPDFEIGEKLSESELRETMGQKFNPREYGFSFDQAFAFFKAITKKESGGNYEALGRLITKGPHAGTKAIGRYQIMEREWKMWTTKEFGRVVPPTARNQDIIAFKKHCEYLQSWVGRGVPFEEAVQLASGNWYGNMGEVLTTNLGSLSTRKPTAVEPSPREYSRVVLGYYRENL